MTHWVHINNEIVNLDKLLLLVKDEDFKIIGWTNEGKQVPFKFSSVEQRDQVFIQIVSILGANYAFSTGKKSVCY